MRAIMMCSGLAVLLSACATEGLTGVSAPQPVVVASSHTVSSRGTPLILLDGREISDSTARVLFTDSTARTGRLVSIWSVEVLKRKAAMARYGERAGFGVIVIVSDSAYRAGYR